MEPSAYEPRDFLWSQRDLRWADLRLGQSELDCGHYGCAALCTTYVIDRRLKDVAKPFLYPSQVIKEGAFTTGGAIYWNTVDKLSEGHAVQTYDKAEAHYTLMEVVWGTYHHWIVQLDGDLCYDPWDAQIKPRVQSKWYPSGRYIYYKLA